MNEDLNEENVDKLRKRWETDDHWALRKEFILQHKDSFELNRLLSLSQLFLNVETMQNVYSPDLMTLVERLASQVEAVSEFRAKRKILADQESQKKPKKIRSHPNNYRNNYNGPNRRFNRRTF